MLARIWEPCVTRQDEPGATGVPRPRKGVSLPASVGFYVVV